MDNQKLYDEWKHVGDVITENFKPICDHLYENITNEFSKIRDALNNIADNLHTS